MWAELTFALIAIKEVIRKQRMAFLILSMLIENPASPLRGCYPSPRGGNPCVLTLGLCDMWAEFTFALIAIKESIPFWSGFFDSIVWRFPTTKGYNSSMCEYKFTYPIEVRYGDLDPQGHVNNAKFLTYFEQTRVNYLVHLGLFDKNRSFMDVGIILAEARVTFRSPLNFGVQAQVGARTTRLGNKSFEMIYSLQEANSPQVFATGSAVLVTYDYRSQKTLPIPRKWRDTITAFEDQ